MKKYYAFFLALVMVLLCFVSCKNNTDNQDFSPVVTVDKPYSINGNVINATFYNCGIISPFKNIHFSEGKPLLYFDDSLQEYLDSEYFIPEGGVHDYVIVVNSNDNSSSVKYVLRIENIYVDKLYVEKVYDTQYAIGQVFDKNSVLVYSLDENGNKIEIKDYECTYSFEEEGTSTVEISVGRIKTEYLVTVSGTFVDILDQNMNSSSGARYEIVGNSAEIVDGKNVKGSFSVPESITYEGKSYVVSAIKDEAFMENKDINALQINSPVDIGESAFNDCSNLTYVDLCEGTTIGRFAFAYCTSLKTIVLPQDLDRIKDGTFTHCAQLALTELPSTITKIESQAFSFCESLTEIHIPQNTEYIGARAFKSCYSLKTLVCGAGLKEIGDGVFSDNPALEMLVLPGDVIVKDVNVIHGDDNITVYAGSTSMLIYHCNKNGIPFVKLKDNSSELIIKKKTFKLNDEIRDSEIGLILNTEDYLGFAPNFGLSYDFSVPGERTVSVKYGDYAATVNVFVEYKLNLAADTDESGNIYELDENTGKAYLKELNSSDNGTYILPTCVISGDNEYEVVGVKSGAIGNCKDLKKLFLHSNTVFLDERAISDCATLELIYFATPKGIAVKILDDNFTRLSGDFIILCSNVNATVMYNYVRTNNIKFAGLERDSLYITSTKSAQRLYEDGEEFNPEGFNIVYIDSDWNCIDLKPDEVNIRYDFGKSGIVEIEYKGKVATYVVTVI